MTKRHVLCLAFGTLLDLLKSCIIIGHGYIQGSINLFNSGRIAKIYTSRGFIVPPELISYIADLK